MTMWVPRTSNDQCTSNLEKNPEHTEYMAEKHVTSECVASLDLSDPKQLTDFKHYGYNIRPKKDQLSGIGYEGKPTQGHTIQGKRNYLVTSPDWDIGSSGGSAFDDRKIGMFVLNILNFYFI